MKPLRNLCSVLKENRPLAILLVLELLVLLWVAAQSLHPSVQVTFTGAEMTDTGNFEVTTYPDGSASAYVELPVDEASMLEMPLSLPEGGYDVQVSYQSVATPQGSTGDSYSYAGWVSVESQSNPDGVISQRLYLRDVSSVRTDRFTLRLGGGIQDLTLKVYQYGYGTLTIQQIQVRECLSYRLARFLGYLGIFGAVDLLYLIFAGRSPLRLKKSRKYAILGVLLITGFACVAFFTDYLLQGHDLNFHLNRIMSLAQSISQGQIPQRIQPEMLNGYGYATPLFYGELFLLPAAILLLIGVPVQTAYQIYVVLVTLATCLVSYWCFNKITADWKKALFGAAVYTMAAYRMVNLLLRAAVGEYTAMAFLPLIAYGFYRIYTAGEEESLGLRDYMPLVLGLTGILQAHVLTCEITALFILALVVICIKKTLQPRRFFALAKAALLTVAINAWYLVPFLQSMVGMGLQMGTVNAEENAVYWVQMFSFFTNVTGSAYGSGTYQELPMLLGPAFLAGLAAWLFWLVRQTGERETVPGQRAASAFFLMGIAGMVLASDLIPWNNLQSISKSLRDLALAIQFPMRYLALAECLLAFGAVLLVQTMERRGKGQWGRVLMGVMLGLTILTAGSLSSNAAREIKEINVYSPADINTMLIMGGEYLLPGTDIDQLADREVHTQEGVAARDYLREGLLSQVWCENTLQEDSYLDLPVMNYGNYHAWLEDGTEVPVSTGENNRVRVTLPAGYTGQVYLNYREPLLWRVCEGVSLAALGGSLFWLWRKRRSSPRELPVSP